MNRKTTFSACRSYRYCLWREWDRRNPRYAMFVGLNPSTADERKDDPTIRRCVDFAKRWRYGAVCVANLFAYRATEPKVLKAHVAPVGEENNRWLIKLAKGAAVIVAAWGSHGTHLNRDEEVMRLLGGKRKLSCLKKTKAGHPGHPLYLKKILTPIPFA